MAFSLDVTTNCYIHEKRTAKRRASLQVGDLILATALVSGECAVPEGFGIIIHLGPEEKGNLWISASKTRIRVRKGTVVLWANGNKMVLETESCTVSSTYLLLTEKGRMD